MAVPGCAQAPECLPEGSGGEDGWGAGRLGGSQSASPAPPPQGGGAQGRASAEQVAAARMQ